MGPGDVSGGSGDGIPCGGWKGENGEVGGAPPPPPDIGAYWREIEKRSIGGNGVG